MEAILIGELAKRAGVISETVRFYERERLIARPARERGSYRRYPPSTVERIRFIRRAKELGFTLEDIRELLSLRDRRGGCAAVRARAELKIVELDDRIGALTRMRAALVTLAARCEERPAAGDCPILRSLDTAT